MDFAQFWCFFSSDFLTNASIFFRQCLYLLYLGLEKHVLTLDDPQEHLSFIFYSQPLLADL